MHDLFFVCFNYSYWNGDFPVCELSIFFCEIFHITSITKGYPKIIRRFGINIGHFVSPMFGWLILDILIWRFPKSWGAPLVLIRFIIFFSVLWNKPSNYWVLPMETSHILGYWTVWDSFQSHGGIPLVLIHFHIINHPVWDTHMYGNLHVTDFRPQIAATRSRSRVTPRRRFRGTEWGAINVGIHHYDPRRVVNYGSIVVW